MSDVQEKGPYKNPIQFSSGLQMRRAIPILPCAANACVEKNAKRLATRLHPSNLQHHIIDCLQHEPA